MPPRDALPTAKQIVAAVDIAREKPPPLYYLDLNAIRPELAKDTAALFQLTPIRYADGGVGSVEIIGHSSIFGS